MTEQEIRSRECFELLDRSGDPAFCKERYPELAAEIDSFRSIQQRFRREASEGPSEDVFARRRRVFLSSLTQASTPSRFSLKSVRLAFLGAVIGAMAVAAVSASAAVGGPAPGLEKLLNTLDGNHGQAVREAAQGADSQTAGVQRGGSVSAAVCEAAHDRDTLPAGAQTALGQEKDKEPKDCDKTNQGVAGLEIKDKKNANTAACLANQDRSRLPDGAQNAPGQLEEPKDCEEAEDNSSSSLNEEEGDEEDGKLKNEPPGLDGGTPPGQEKKGSVVDPAGSGDEEDTDLTECAPKLDRSTLPSAAQNSPGLTNNELPCKEPESTQAGNSEKQTGKPDNSEKQTGKPESAPGGPPNR